MGGAGKMAQTPPVPAMTVVLPVHNRTATLRRALGSIVNQSLDDFECIVIDDGSDHDVADIVSAYDDRRLRLIRREHNGGPYAARLTGLRAMRGHYAFFLDSDDELYPWALERARHHLDTTPCVDLVCALYLHNSDSRLAVRVSGAPRVVTPAQAMLEPPIPDRVAAVRRCVVDEWFRKRTDYFAFEVHLALTTMTRHASLYVDEPWTVLHSDATAGRVTRGTITARQLDDYNKFFDDHWDLIAQSPGPWVLLDTVLRDVYFTLWRARRPEATRAAQALRLRGLSPWRACLNVAARRAGGRLRRQRHSHTLWL